MLLWDGSRHDWLEGRGPGCALIAAIDDAIRRAAPGAGTSSTRNARRAISGSCGRSWPRTGCRGVFTWISTAPCSGNDDHWTPAKSSAASRIPRSRPGARGAGGRGDLAPLAAGEGRVERLWGTLLDRLVSELRLAGARTIAEANAVLDRYMPRRTTGASPFPRRTPRPRGARCAAVSISTACVASATEATVLNDNTIRCGDGAGHPARAARPQLPRQARRVRQLLDRSWRVYLGDHVIATGPPRHGELRAQRAQTWARRPHHGATSPRLIEAAP